MKILWPICANYTTNKRSFCKAGRASLASPEYCPIAPLHFSPLLLHSWQLHHLGLADRRHLKTTMHCIVKRLHCKRWCFIYFYYIVPCVCAIWENMRFYTISWNAICNNYCDICWLWGYLNLPRVFLYREKRFTRWLWNKIQTVFETKNYFIRWIQKR